MQKHIKIRPLQYAFFEYIPEMFVRNFSLWCFHEVLEGHFSNDLV